MNKLKYYFFETTDSVMNRLREYAVLGKNCVCVAGEQTMGRGTKGRTFYSLKGFGAFFGLLYFPSFDESSYYAVTPAAAVAVSEAVDELCLINTGIKWVNDVYFDNKKICGILTESGGNEFGRYLIIGIGINLKEPEGGFPEEIKNIAGALPVEVDRNEIVEKVVEKLVLYLDELPRKSFAFQYQKKNVLVGKKVSYVYGNDFGEGIAKGFDERFAIIIDTVNGEKVLDAGEVKLI